VPQNSRNILSDFSLFLEEAEETVVLFDLVIRVFRYRSLAFFPVYIVTTFKFIEITPAVSRALENRTVEDLTIIHMRIGNDK
jgi:hypothetical protein